MLQRSEPFYLQPQTKKQQSFVLNMSSTPKKTIAIVGATGNQGSSVAHTFLGLQDWHVLCLTRDPSSAKARALADLGAEIMRADLSDISTLAPAFADAHAIFVNTDFWGTYRGALAAGTDGAAASRLAYDTEVQHGKNAASAAAAAAAAPEPRLERFVYSALGPMAAASGGRYTHSYHWEAKAAVVQYVEESPKESAEPAAAAATALLRDRASFVYAGGYTTNAFLYPTLDPRSGEYVAMLPMRRDARIPVIDAAASMGGFVRALVEDEPAGTKLLAYDCYPTVGEMVVAWSRVTKRPARHVQLSLDAMRDLTGLPLEVLDGPAFLDEYDYVAGVDGVIEPHQLKKAVKAKSFEEMLRQRDVSELLAVRPVM